MWNKDQAEQIAGDILTLTEATIDQIDTALQLGEGISDNPTESAGLIEDVLSEQYTLDGNLKAKSIMKVQLTDDGSFPAEEDRIVNIIVRIENEELVANF